MALIIQLKNALEYVRFSSPEIRDAFVGCINELGLDMDEVCFEPARNTELKFSELDKALTDYDNQDETSVTYEAEVEEVEIEHKEVTEVPEDDTFDIGKEVDRIVERVDEDDEFEIDRD